MTLQFVWRFPCTDCVLVQFWMCYKHQTVFIGSRMNSILIFNSNFFQSVAVIGFRCQGVRKYWEQQSACVNITLKRCFKRIYLGYQLSFGHRHRLFVQYLFHAYIVLVCQWLGIALFHFNFFYDGYDHHLWTHKPVIIIGHCRQRQDKNQPDCQCTEKASPLFSVHSPEDQEGCNTQTVWNQRCKCSQSQLYTKAKCFYCVQVIKCAIVHFLDDKSRKAAYHSNGKNCNKIYAKLLKIFHIHNTWYNTSVNFYRKIKS